MNDLAYPLPTDTWQVENLRRRMVQHPVFNEIRDIDCLKIFMEAHVFAVWDFMSLAKRLQRELTCVELPWLPRTNRRAARLINEIVLGEETDLGPDGEPISHLELYLGAMREIGANVERFERFQNALASGVSLAAAFDLAEAPDFVRAFSGYTLEIAQRAPLLAAISSFFHGREDVIPHMFQSLLEGWGVAAASAPMFVYYLERHIEVDAGEHGPAAEAILDRAVGGDPARRDAVLRAACDSIRARIRFWDGLLDRLRSRDRTPVPRKTEFPARH